MYSKKRLINKYIEKLHNAIDNGLDYSDSFYKILLDFINDIPEVKAIKEKKNSDFDDIDFGRGFQSVLKKHKIINGE